MRVKVRSGAEGAEGRAFPVPPDSHKHMWNRTHSIQKMSHINNYLQVIYVFT